VIISVQETLNFVALSTLLVGYYKGIEIGHPIFSVIFLNLIVPTACSFANFIALPLLPLVNAYITSMLLNIFSLVFHLTSWSVVSVLRYVLIVYKDWVNQRWPDLRRLRYVALAAQLVSYVAFFALGVLAFRTGAGPYGWPKLRFYDIPGVNVMQTFCH
jgi:hypothetical protein